MVGWISDSRNFLLGLLESTCHVQPILVHWWDLSIHFMLVIWISRSDSNLATFGKFPPSGDQQNVWNMQFPTIIWNIDNSIHCMLSWWHDNDNDKWSLLDDVIKGKHFGVTGRLWGEPTGHLWIPIRMASDVELWSAPEQTVEPTIDTPVIWF